MPEELLGSLCSAVLQHPCLCTSLLALLTLSEQPIALKGTGGVTSRPIGSGVIRLQCLVIFGAIDVRGGTGLRWGRGFLIARSYETSEAMLLLIVGFVLFCKT